MKLILPFLSLFFISTLLSAQSFLVEDIFNRDLTDESITLVDWEGYMANPAIKLLISPPTGVSYPIFLDITANHPRLYFDMPSSAGVSGPSKTLEFNDGATQEIYVSIFPDRGAGDESYTLTLNSSLGTQTIPIQVKDHDPISPSIDFEFIFDYSEDWFYSFFGNTEQTIAEEAANDWAFFLEDMNFDQVPANNESVYIWDDNYLGGYWTSNSTAYSGFYLYFYGLHVDPHISGGSPSFGSFHSIGGSPTNLRRSGSFNADVHGNYNSLGWNTSITDDTWYLATNYGNVANDFYSIALHEVGHAITFNAGYPVFSAWQTQGFIDDPAIVNYHGSNIPVTNVSHLDDGSLIVDKESKQGLFGSEYATEMPIGRWLITKLNLMVMEAVGYDLKPTSAFAPVEITTTSLNNANQGSSFSQTIDATGGIPFYEYRIVSGSLPGGLTLNSFTGEISGSPTQTGSFTFTVEVRDYNLEADQRAFVFNIGSGFPIELVSFEGKLGEDLVIDLYWETASELNNDYFIMEHSLDGLQFRKIDSIDGSGTSSGLQQYTTTHNAPWLGDNFYRLIQVDFDGSTTQSEVIHIPLKGEKDLLGAINPNPSRTGFVEIPYTALEPWDLKIELIDVNGKVIESRFHKIDKGYQVLRFSTKSLSAGVYSMKFHTPSETVVRKIVIL